jgi:hypothetical protein
LRTGGGRNELPSSQGDAEPGPRSCLNGTEDRLLRLRVDALDTPENWGFVRAIKETLKSRFDQLDMWITAHHVDVI